MDIEFHQFEESYIQEWPRTVGRNNTIIHHIVCSFKTDKLGFVQVVGMNKEKENRRDVEDVNIRLSTPENFDVLTESEQAYVAKHMTAALLLTFYPHELVN